MYDSTMTVAVGLDVHARSIRLAAVRADELLEERTLPYDEDAVEQVLRRWLGVRCCYEAGPTGFGLYRHLIGRGIDCSVDARGPSAQSRGASPVSRGPAAAVRCSLALGRGKEDANRDALDGGRLVADVLPVAAADVDRFERINVVGRHDAYIVWLSRLLKDKLPLHAQAKSRGLGKMRIAARGTSDSIEIGARRCATQPRLSRSSTGRSPRSPRRSRAWRHFSISRCTSPRPSPAIPIHP